MVKEELIQRSPVGVFMRSIQGGLKQGELGVISSLSGLGKTSMLVQIALDKLLQGKKIIHVSFTQHTDYVLTWYEDIFDEFIKKKNLENQQDVKNEIIKNRVLMKFNQEGITVDQILRSLTAMIRDGGFSAECVIVDGYKFSPEDTEKVSKIKKFAQELGISVWFSCTVNDESPYDKQNIPVLIKNYAELFDIIVILEPKKDHIELAISKNRGVPKLNNTDNAQTNAQQKSAASSLEHLALRLDPKTLLILEE